MRSIRLSLVVYFLLLLVGALGAVSWLVYETTARTLHDKEQSTRNLIAAQRVADCKEAETELDQRLLRQAQTLAAMTCAASNHFESLYPFGMLGAAPMPQGHLLIPLWLAEGTHPHFSPQLYRSRRLDFQIENAEKLVSRSSDQPQEFFQVFRDDGQLVVRSEFLEDEEPMPLQMEANKSREFFVGHFENAELSGLPTRQVTLKANVPRFRSASLNLSWRLIQPEPKKTFFDARKSFFSRPGSARPPIMAMMPPLQRFKGFDKDLPIVYIQYGSDRSQFDDKMRRILAIEETNVARLQTETRAALGSLRQRLWYISLATFAAILLGGFFLVWLGLAPLRRLSEAVSQVSARDFKLNVDQDQLPEELQPIAGRLTETLEQLKKAFSREKQAAADISHELRTPLAALLTTVELALRKPRSAEEYREFFQDCQGSGQQLMHLVERLLALARFDAGSEALKPRSIDVADLAHQCADLVRPLAQARGLELKVQTDSALPLEGDPDKLREVLTNLLHNAIEYNRPQGSIALTVQRENGHLLMEVSDTGIGITPEARERIFERFYRADPSRHADTPHAGLGLSIVKSCIDLMGGQIEVQSDPGGSTFRIQIPAK